MVVLKGAEALVAMRQAGRIVAKVLALLRERMTPGTKVSVLNVLAEAEIRRRGAEPSFIGYPNNVPGASPFPGAICVSVNDALVHGIPDERLLSDGDIVSVDCGAQYQGYHADAAITVPIGQVRPKARALLRVTKESLDLGIAQAQAGRRLGDVTAAIQQHIESQGYKVVREYTSHCIGSLLHEGFVFPNLGKPGRGMKLRRGMTVALEPMVTLGDGRMELLADGWTVVSCDGSLSAHFEHTIAIGNGDAEILTRL